MRFGGGGGTLKYIYVQMYISMQLYVNRKNDRRKKRAVREKYLVFQIHGNTFHGHISHVFSSSKYRSAHGIQYKTEKTMRYLQFFFTLSEIYVYNFIILNLKIIPVLIIMTLKVTLQNIIKK